MLPIVEKLLVLQDRDRRLIRLRAELESIPGHRLHLQTKAAKTQQEFDAVKKRAIAIESDRKRLELEVETLKQRINKIQAEQMGTKSNDQYKAFQHQVETSQGEIAKLDDRQLELMEQGETLAGEVQAASRLAKEQKEESDRHLAELATREENLKKDRDQVLAERARLAAELDPPDVSRYERILKSRGENVVVGVGNVICGGCHMKLPMQTFLEAKGEVNLTQCPNCARILYYTREMEPDAATRRDML